MRAELSKPHNRLQTTIIYVTHDQTEAMTMGDRIVVMKDGFIKQVGAPLEIYQRPDNMFVAGFIGSPAMNFIPGVLRKKATISSSIASRSPPECRCIARPAQSTTSTSAWCWASGPRASRTRISSEPAPDRVIECTVDVMEPMRAEVCITSPVALIPSWPG